MSRQKPKPKSQRTQSPPSPPRDTAVVQAQAETQKKTEPSEPEAKPTRWYAKLAKIKSEWVVAVFTALVAIVTAVYAWFTYGLWSVSVAQLRSNEKSFKQQHRAWVGVKTLQLVKAADGTAYSNIVFHNFGTSPARELNIHVQGIIYRRSFPILDIVGGKLTQLSRTDRVGTLAQGDEQRQREKLNLTTAQVGAMDARDAFYVLYGKIFYEDIFRESHLTTFCGCFDVEKPDTMRACGKYDTME